jgi:cytochrome c peroxidase
VRRAGLVAGLGVLLVSSCGEAPPPSGAAAEVPIAPPGFPPLVTPDDNPFTVAKIALGRRLFHDKRLSRTEEVACASCHLQDHAFSDPRATSVGVEGRGGTRNAPALVNLAYGRSFFWDGSAPSLERQVMAPIVAVNEMDLPIDQAVARLAADPGYRQDFADGFGGAPSEAFLSRALAAFVRTLVSGDSPYDRWKHGDEPALAADQKRGMALFFGERAACFHCHDGFNFTNERFANNGSFLPGGDVGRQRLTASPNDLGRFKVPTLRNVAVSAPYMHDGSLPTLEAVVEQYVAGGRAGDPNTDPAVHPLELSEGDRRDLVAFLGALTDQAFLEDPRHRP